MWKKWQKTLFIGHDLESERGFSLLEVLLSIAITILLTDLIIQLCISLIKQQALLKENSILVENAQWAEFILKREIQTAGFCGCNKLNQLNIHYHLTRSYLPITPIQVFSKNSCISAGIHPESDIIVIEKMSEKPVSFLAKSTTKIKVKCENCFKLDEPLIASDCSQADVFIPSNIKYANSFQWITPKKILKYDHSQAALGKLVATAFFIEKTHRKNRYGQIIKALYSYDLIRHQKIERVSGVEAMAVFCGIWNEDEHTIHFEPASSIIDLPTVRLIKIVLSLVNENPLFGSKKTLQMQREIVIYLRELM